MCVLPYEAVRWALIGVATLSSGLFLLLNFRGPIFDVAGAKCARRRPRALSWLADLEPCVLAGTVTVRTAVQATGPLLLPRVANRVGCYTFVRSKKEGDPHHSSLDRQPGWWELQSQATAGGRLRGVARACRAFPVWAAMGVLHLGLGLALKLYVFQYWSS